MLARRVCLRLRMCACVRVLVVWDGYAVGEGVEEGVEEGVGKMWSEKSVGGRCQVSGKVSGRCREGVGKVSGRVSDRVGSRKGYMLHRFCCITCGQ